MIFSEQPEKLADFYAKVAEKKLDMDDGGYYGFLAGKTFLSSGKDNAEF